MSMKTLLRYPALALRAGVDASLTLRVGVPALALGACMLLMTTAAAQERSKIYSRPALPSAEALRRLNLTMAWTRLVPMDGRRDRLFSVQLDHKDMLVQTRSGLVMVLDAETGVVRWKQRVGNPYEATKPLAFNSRGVYVINSTFLFALDRATGTRQWRYSAPAGVSSAPLADTEQLYLPTATKRLYAYYLPRPEPEGAVPGLPAGPGSTAREGRRAGTIEGELRPITVWIEQADMPLGLNAVQSVDTVLVVSPEGQVKAYSKVPREGRPSNEVYRLDLDTQVSIHPGSFKDTAFIGGKDSNLYAIDMVSGRIRWRYTAGTPISRQPIALDREVYVTSERGGLVRVNGDTGEALWRVPQGRRILESNPDADRFLAANPKFVYAFDASGRLLVLDRKRGVRLSTYDTVSFRYPIPNPVTDRLYLAANNGLIVCLHDRDYATPIRHRVAEEEAANPLKQKLLLPVTEPGLKSTPLRDVLTYLRTRYAIKFVLSERAFKEAGIEGIGLKKVIVPTMIKRPLADLLTRVFNAADATYQVVDDTILVLPKGVKPKPKPEKGGM
jgi:outer membrane protein assembly factor BamB